MPTLMVIQGPDKGLRVNLPDGQAVQLGRASQALALTDYTVSRKHAELKPLTQHPCQGLKPVGRGWSIEDLKSANGTYVNGKRLERPTRLKHGDQVRIGGTLLIWDSAGQEAIGQGGSGMGTTAGGDLVDLGVEGVEDERLASLKAATEQGAARPGGLSTTAPEASIIASVGAGDDSMILASPAAAEAVRSWRVMSSLLDAVGAVMSPRQLVERVMDIIFEEVPAERGYILMKDQATGRFEFEAMRWAEPERDTIRATRAIADRVVANKEGVLCSNAMAEALDTASVSRAEAAGQIERDRLGSVKAAPGEPRRANAAPEEEAAGEIERDRLGSVKARERDRLGSVKAAMGHPSSSLKPQVSSLGLQSVICVPLVTREEVIGVIYVDCPMGRHIHTEEQLRLVAAIGQMAGLAIDDARLVHERVHTERLAAAGETVAALSHYIKNILQGLTGGSDLVEMGLKRQSVPMVDQGWQVVQRNLDKIYSLTMNMLAYAKQREPRLEPVQINTVVEDVLKLVARRAEDKGVVVKADLADGLPAIPMDEHGVHQVLLNIIANAIDAVPKNTGVINVTTTFDAASDSAVVCVADNGPGIPAEVRERIFDAFYSTKGHGGTGLGLAVARKIMDEHLGRIGVDSVPGEGTIIRIVLPAKPMRGIDSAETHGPGAAP